ncbi:HPP family protein [Motiliproteus sp. SC1-56]|uniref:CBS domain-containing protein n=1 Tax=Motiliproteus sp. SC1-56 TaxID=2799565 RepID=UPI001A8E42DA|nr:CBS domain-containing protein [Motiliproteus sp. SC1-56]
MEQLRQKKQPVPRQPRTRRSFWDEPDASSPLLAFTQTDDGATRFSQAETLYRRMLNLRINEPIVHVHQVMSEYVYTLSLGETLADARRRMCEYRVEQMPVVCPEYGVVSLITRRDIEALLIDERLTLEALTRRSVDTRMPEEVITTEPVASIRRVAQVMSDYQQSAMPVVDDRNKLVGIITRGDILRVLAKQPKLSLWT